MKVKDFTPDFDLWGAKVPIFLNTISRSVTPDFVAFLFNALVYLFILKSGINSVN